MKRPPSLIGGALGATVIVTVLPSTVVASGTSAVPPIVVDTPTGPVMTNGIVAFIRQTGQVVTRVGTRPVPVAAARGDATPADACGDGNTYCSNAQVYSVSNLPCNRNCDQITGGDVATVLTPASYDVNGAYSWWGLTNDVQLAGGRDDMCVIYGDLDVNGPTILMDDRPQGTREIGSATNLSFTVSAPIPGSASFGTGVTWSSYPGKIGSWLSSDFKTFDTAWREQNGNCTQDSQAIANGAIWRVPNGSGLGWSMGFTVYYNH